MKARNADLIASGAYAYRHFIADFDADLERAAETMPIRLFRITSVVTFPAPSGGQRTFELATTRIGAREP